ncbi:hypothetical protein TcWFU_004418 [Taenia crassiceps]|uniref:Uncharacterized protein n=1 Tax=Taenia crassiceps TaxID=6207 RepID=A0ABR4Q8S6_9CEST
MGKQDEGKPSLISRPFFLPSSPFSSQPTAAETAQSSLLGVDLGAYRNPLLLLSPSQCEPCPLGTMVSQSVFMDVFHSRFDYAYTLGFTGLARSKPPQHKCHSYLRSTEQIHATSSRISTAVAVGEGGRRGELGVARPFSRGIQVCEKARDGKVLEPCNRIDVPPPSLLWNRVGLRFALPEQGNQQLASTSPRLSPVECIICRGS